MALKSTEFVVVVVVVVVVVARLLLPGGHILVQSILLPLKKIREARDN